MRVVELAGSPEELGRQHGQILGPEIREMRRALWAYLARISLGVGALPLYAGFLWLARRFWSHLPASLQQELKGVAAGAEMHLGSVLLINVADDLGNNSPRCSALAVGEGRTQEGAYLMGRNLDYPLFIDLLIRLQTLFKVEPAPGLPFASLAWPGFVGVCTGLNRAGVALAQLSAMSRERTLKGIPAAMRFRLGLETEGTVAGVASRVLEAPGTIGNNLLLCSPGEAAVVELSARRGVVRRPRQGLLTVTNHYQSEAMRPFKGRFPPRPPLSPLAPYHFSEAYSQARNARLQELARGRQLGPADLQAILADERVANLGTAGTTIFSPEERTLWVAQAQAAPVSRGPYTPVKLWG